VIGPRVFGEADSEVTAACLVDLDLNPDLRWNFVDYAPTGSVQIFGS
jgi:hypothetical protein